MDASEDDWVDDTWDGVGSEGEVIREIHRADSLRAAKATWRV